jgi:hypothetical protein
MKCRVHALFLYIGVVLVFRLTGAFAQGTNASSRQTPPDTSRTSGGIPDRSAFLPLEVGNEWVYSDGTSKFAIQVLSAVQDPDRGTYFEVSGYFPGDSVKVRKLRRGPRGQILEYNPNGDDFQWYRFGPGGEVWRFEAGEDIPCISGSSVSTGKLGETVEAPAGTFERTLRLDFVSRCMDAGIVSEFYADGVGLVQRVLNTIAGPRVVRLVSARVGPLTFPATPYGVEVTMDRPVYFNNLMPPIVNPWPTAWAKLVVRNETGTPVELAFPTAQRFDFIVRDASGTEVLRWSDGRVFAAVESRENLLKGSLVYPVDISLKGREGKPLPAGFYTLAGYLTTSGFQSGLLSSGGFVTFEVRDLH